MLKSAYTVSNTLCPISVKSPQFPIVSGHIIFPVQKQPEKGRILSNPENAACQAENIFPVWHAAYIRSM